MTGKKIGLVLLILVAAGGTAAALYFYEQTNRLTETLTELDAKNSDQRQQLSGLQERTDALSTQLETATDTKEDLGQQIQTLTKEKEALQSKVANLEEQLENASTKLSRAASTMSAAGKELSRLKTQNAQLEKRLETYTAELQQKQSKLRQVSDTHKRLVGELRREIAERQIKITQLGDSLSVRMIGNILFPTGKAELTGEGIAVLRRVGDIISKVEEKTIRVEGHTDDRPISYALRKVYPSNWELSTARATNVVHFLTNEIGIPPERLEAVGRAQFHPVATNETPEGRSRNRRIEILLVPPQETKETPLAVPEADEPEEQDGE